MEHVVTKGTVPSTHALAFCSEIAARLQVIAEESLMPLLHTIRTAAVTPATRFMEHAIRSLRLKQYPRLAH
jgi:hypothetical protein